MMQPVLSAVFFVSVVMEVVLACPPDASTIDYRNKLCQSDVVFTGTAVSGMSSLAVAEDGRQLQSSTITFQVQQYFKDSTGKGEDRIKVGRVYTEGDPCESASFPGLAGSFLVFAQATSYNGYVRVAPCDYTVPWNCVPDSARGILSRENC